MDLRAVSQRAIARPITAATVVQSSVIEIQQRRGDAGVRIPEVPSFPSRALNLREKARDLGKGYLRYGNGTATEARRTEIRQPEIFPWFG